MTGDMRRGEMPTLTIPDGEIYYEVYGSGYPLMIFAGRATLGACLLAAQPVQPVGTRGVDGS